MIVTLATMYGARGFTLIYNRGWPSISFPIPCEFAGLGNIGPVRWPLIVLTGVALVFHFIFTCAPAGRHICAMGGNLEAARVSGMPIHGLSVCSSPDEDEVQREQRIGL